MMLKKNFPVEKVITAIAASLAANRDVVLRAPPGITDVRDVRLTSRMKELARRWRRMVLPFAVNASPERVSARLTAERALSAEVLYEDRKCTAVDGKIVDCFAPFAVHIYKWREHGSGDPCMDAATQKSAAL